MELTNKVKNKNSIQFGIEYNEPIELGEFTKSLNGFSNQYKKFVNDTYGSEQPVNPKLHIEKIKEGSIITTLVEYSELAIPFLGEVNTMVEFGKHLKELYSYFSLKKEKPKETEVPTFDINTLQNISDILKPGTNLGNTIKIEVTGENNNTQVLVLDANDNKSSEIVKTISKNKKKLKEPKTNIYTKQLFYFDQARKDINSKVGNYGVIESLHNSKLRVIFEDDKKDKKKMLKGDGNPLKCMYIVDVEMQVAKGEPKVYKILKLHEIIED